MVGVIKLGHQCRRDPFTARSVVRRLTHREGLHFEDLTRQGPCHITSAVKRRDASTRHALSTSILAVSNLNRARVRERLRPFLLRNTCRRASALRRRRHVTHLSKSRRVHGTFLCASTRGLRAALRSAYKHVAMATRSTIEGQAVVRASARDDVVHPACPRRQRRAHLCLLRFPNVLFINVFGVLRHTNKVRMVPKVRARLLNVRDDRFNRFQVRVRVNRR